MNVKKIMALLLVFAMVCSFAACDEPKAEAPEEQPAAAPGYSVTVVDAFGNPYTDGIIVRFMQNGQQVSMQVVDANGTVSKELEKGDYTVELQFTNKDAAYYYDQSNLTLSADKTALEIVLYNALSGEPQVLAAPTLKGDHQNCDAYQVGEGGTYVELVPGERNYFLFTPTRGGTYEFSVQGSDAAIGYYGAPHFVQEVSAIDAVDNKIVSSVKDSMVSTGNTGTTIMVIGLDAPADDTDAILTIQRTGEPQWDVTDEPWQIYQATIELQDYKHNGKSLGEFDLKAASDAYNLVLGSDNYYHLDSADGPLVLVRLGKAAGTVKYLDTFETILEHSGVTKYFFDDEGNFVKKESYSECLLEYIKHVDEDTGLYPLTEDLKYIIQMRGDHYGWFDQENPGYIFLDANNNPVVGINHDISWLFMCCYAKN